MENPRVWTHIRRRFWKPLPETNSKFTPWKLMGWKDAISFWEGLFSGARLVSGRVNTPRKQWGIITIGGQQQSWALKHGCFEKDSFRKSYDQKISRIYLHPLWDGIHEHPKNPTNNQPSNHQFWIHRYTTLSSMTSIQLLRPHPFQDQTLLHQVLPERCGQKKAKTSMEHVFV